MDYRPGKAFGPTAITLDDGSRWFWYHQSKHECDCNPFIEELGVRTSEIHYRFPEDYDDKYGYEEIKDRSRCCRSACSSYTLSIALANLIGRDYDIYELWKDLDAKTPVRSADWDNEYLVDLISTINGTGRDLIMNPSILQSKLGKVFPMLKIRDVSTFDRSMIDSLLDDPHYETMIILDVKKSSICTSEGHYVVLFRKNGDKYGLITSASNPYGDTHEDYVKLSNRWLSWEELMEELKYFSISLSMDKRYYDQ